MKNFLLSLVVLTCGAVSALSGQELSVKSFELRPTDLTAKIANKKDMNGDVCAMVKIFVVLPTISVPADMILDEVEKAAYSEFRVFMPAGSRRIRINTPGFLPLEYNFPEPLETMRTYELRLWRGGELPPPPRPEVGKYYAVDKECGIVVEYNDATKSGKFIALSDAPQVLIWDDAISYCTGVGNGWRLPTKEEMGMIFGNRKVLKKSFDDANITALGGTWMKEGRYWTGTNVDASKMFPCYVDMKDGKLDKIHKKNSHYVRAIYDFKVPEQY